jgi:hypothetical protein
MGFIVSTIIVACICLPLWIPVSKLLFRAFFRTVTGTKWDGK